MSEKISKLEGIHLWPRVCRKNVAPPMRVGIVFQISDKTRPRKSKTERLVWYTQDGLNFLYQNGSDPARPRREGGEAYKSTRYGPIFPSLSLLMRRSVLCTDVAFLSADFLLQRAWKIGTLHRCHAEIVSHCSANPASA
ncbi:MAG: hypothetical protein ACRC46_15620 [Thermoguttaceae bacterium]